MSKNLARQGAFPTTQGSNNRGSTPHRRSLIASRYSAKLLALLASVHTCTHLHSLPTALACFKGTCAHTHNLSTSFTRLFFVIYSSLCVTTRGIHTRSCSLLALTRLQNSLQASIHYMGTLQVHWQCCTRVSSALKTCEYSTYKIQLPISPNMLRNEAMVTSLWCEAHTMALWYQLKWALRLSKSRVSREERREFVLVGEEQATSCSRFSPLCTKRAWMAGHI